MLCAEGFGMELWQPAQQWAAAATPQTATAGGQQEPGAFAEADCWSGGQVEGRHCGPDIQSQKRSEP